MTNIVERLKSLANHFDDHAIGAETCRRAIREIESLRQRVKELGQENIELHLVATHSEKELREERQRRWDGNADSAKELALLSKQLKSCLANKWKLRCEQAEAELAALKAGQGEPVAWMWVRPGDVTRFTTRPITPSFNCWDISPTPLYTSAPTIPAGWQLVPVEPTPKMVASVRGHAGSNHANHYRAMLAAAPKQGETSEN